MYIQQVARLVVISISIRFFLLETSTSKFYLGSFVLCYTIILITYVECNLQDTFCLLLYVILIPLNGSEECCIFSRKVTESRDIISR